MPTTNRDPKFKDLQDLGRRIDTSIREFREQDRFSDADKVFLHEIEEKRVCVQQKLEAAVQHNNLMEIISFELNRDFNALSDSLSSFIRKF